MLIMDVSTELNGKEVSMSEEKSLPEGMKLTALSHGAG